MITPILPNVLLTDGLRLRFIGVWLALYYVLMPFSGKATTIVPFTSLGEMSAASDAVVLARACQEKEIMDQGLIRYRTVFAVEETIHGQLPMEFDVQDLRLS